MDVWMYGCMDVWMYGCMEELKPENLDLLSVLLLAT